MTIAGFDLCVYLLFFSIFKMYIIPEVIRQAIKIATLILVFAFLVKRLKRKDIFNYSLLFVSAVIISAMWNYFYSGSYTIKAMLDSFLYALTFYDFCTIFLYANRYGKEKRMACDLYKMNLVYCLLTISSVLIAGVNNNSNVAIYIFGNKFTSSYLFISCLALYGLTHDMKLKKHKRNFFAFVFLTVGFSLYVGCATAVVSLIAAIVFFFVQKKSESNLAQNPMIVVCSLVGTAVMPFMIDFVLKNKIVNYIIFDLFQRGYTVYGRFDIYNNYLFDLLKNKFWLGYGYSNGIMLKTTGVFGNAQNGMLEQMMNFGFVGIVIILITVAFALRKKKELSYMTILLYAMILAAIFEVTINWSFWLAIFSIQYLGRETKGEYKHEKG